MDKVKIVETKYVAISREDILECLGSGLYKLRPFFNEEKINLKKHVRKWAYFPLVDELDHTT